MKSFSITFNLYGTSLRICICGSMLTSAPLAIVAAPVDGLAIDRIRPQKEKEQMETCAYNIYGESLSLLFGWLLFLSLSLVIILHPLPLGSW